MINPLTQDKCKHLATLLPDTPQTVISRAHLRWGTARAYAIGLTNDAFETAVVEDPGCPGEPVIFGNNAQKIADLMPRIPNWFCINVASNLADILAPLLAKRLNRPVRQMEDVYFTLNQPSLTNHQPHPAVRLLTPEDLPLLQAAPSELRGPDPEHLLQKTAVAGAIVEGKLVAVAQNYALTEGYGDVGVHTLPNWRGHGFATTAAALVAHWLQQNGRVPVWSCGEHNQPSLRIAEKLGFVENGRRVYIILQE